MVFSMSQHENNAHPHQQITNSQQSDYAPQQVNMSGLQSMSVDQIQRTLSAVPTQQRHDLILQLQPTIGNQAVVNLLHGQKNGIARQEIEGHPPGGNSMIQRAEKDFGYVQITGNKKLDGMLYVKGIADDHKIHPSDINQGKLRDCFALSSFAAVAMQRPDLIENAIEPPSDSAKGVYTVTFYKRKKKTIETDADGSLKDQVEFEPHKIPVTAVFPTGKYTGDDGVEHKTRPHAGTTEHEIIPDTDVKLQITELWAAILEKAYGIFLNQNGGGYDSFTEGGNSALVLEALSGKSTEELDPKSTLVSELGTLLKNKYAIVMGTYSQEDDPLSSNPSMRMPLKFWHAYYLSRVETESSPHVIYIRDPGHWGDEIMIPEQFIGTHFKNIRANPLT